MKCAFSTMVSLLLIFLALSLPLTAQEKKAKPDPEKRAGTETKTEVGQTLTPIQQQALAFLDSLFDQAKEFKDEQSRLRTQAQIADTFWEYDEERARRQFEETFRAINDLKLKKQGNYDPTNAAKSWLRRELLRMISARDSKLADKLLKIIPDVSLTADPASGESEQADALISLALTLAEEDPQRAAQLVETSLKGGISPMLLTVLQIIQQKEPEMADRLFLQVFSVKQNASLFSTMELVMFASYIFPELGGVMPPSAGASIAPSNPTLIEPFLNFAYTSIVGQLSVTLPNAASPQAQEAMRSRNQRDYLYVQQLLPLFQRYLPEKAALIGNRLQQVAGNLSAQERNQMDNFSILFKGETTVSDLVNKADQATDQQQKDSLYSAGAQSAIQAGDFEEAFSIIEKIKNESRKSNLRSSLRTQIARQAIAKGDTDTAYRYAKDVSDLFTRADLFGQIAQKLAEKPDLARANEILTDAEKSLDKAADRSSKALALLSLSAAAAKIDPPHGFEVLKTAVDALNSANYDPPPAAVMTLLRPASSVYGVELDRSFAPLARADFQRARGLAQSIEKKEMSVLAQIAVCRGVLLKAREQQTEAKDQAKEPTESKPDPKKKSSPQR